MPDTIFLNTELISVFNTPLFSEEVTSASSEYTQNSKKKSHAY